MPRKKMGYERKIIAADPLLWTLLRWMAERFGCSVSDLVRLALLRFLVRYLDPLTRSLFSDVASLVDLFDRVAAYSPDLNSFERIRWRLIAELDQLIETFQSKTRQGSDE